MISRSDSHVHLHSQYDRYEAHCCALVNATCEKEWVSIQKLYRNHPESIIPFFGIHPWFISSASDYWFDELEHLLQENETFKVGEIGLDRVKARNEPERCSIEQQTEIFTWQLNLALKYKRHFSVHCVRAWDKLFAALKKAGARYPGPMKGLIHYFKGSFQVMEKLLDYGFYISFHPSLHHQDNTKIQKVFKNCPKDRLLLESDVELSCNRDILAEHYEKSAKLLDMSVENLMRLTCTNVSAYLGKQVCPFKPEPADR